MITDTTLATFFRTWANDYLTLSRFAADHRLSVEDAKTLIDIGRKYHNEIATYQNQVANS